MRPMPMCFARQSESRLKTRYYCSYFSPATSSRTALSAVDLHVVGAKLPIVALTPSRHSFHFIFSFAGHVGRGDWLRRNCLPSPCITAFGEHCLRPFLCFETWQRVTFLAAGNFAEYKAKAFPIVKERCHDARYHMKNPSASSGYLARRGPRTTPGAGGW